MSLTPLWHQTLYKETIGLVIIFLLIVGSLLFFLQQRSPKFTKAWISVKSWIFIAPILFLMAGLPAPWPLIFLTSIAIFSSKTFFRMVGMYHRSMFVWLTYIFIFLIAYMIYQNKISHLNLTPMIFVFMSCLIPLVRNSSAHMIQYIALSTLGFIFLGWSFMHLGLILSLEHGIYVLLYVYLLAEVAFNSQAFYNRFYGKIKPFNKIAPKFSIEGFVFSILLTTLLAWGMRHMLPDRSEIFWLAAGLIFSIFGRAGALIMSVIRRDLGIKDSGVFIIGRDDIIAQVDKYIFSAPIFYYVYLYLMDLPPH